MVSDQWYYPTTFIFLLMLYLYIQKYLSPLFSNSCIMFQNLSPSFPLIKKPNILYYNKGIIKYTHLKYAIH